jgi:hypothetical protein
MPGTKCNRANPKPTKNPIIPAEVKISLPRTQPAPCIDHTTVIYAKKRNNRVVHPSFSLNLFIVSLFKADTNLYIKKLNPFKSF